jgi:hypothetical protein
LANQKSLERPRTRWTSHNGLLDFEHNGLFEHHWLRRLGDAGAPYWSVHPHGCEVSVLDSGWSLDTHPHGCLADGVLIMGNLLQGLDDSGGQRRQNASLVVKTAEVMAGICDRLGLEGVKAVVVDLASEVFDYRMSQYRVHGWALPEDVRADLDRAVEEAQDHAVEEYGLAMDAWGAPSGPGHDSHGHGLSNGHWTCLPEEDS